MNLWWCWNYDAEELFESIDSSLWKECSKNPIIFSRDDSYNRLLKLESINNFLINLMRYTVGLPIIWNRKRTVKEPRLHI